MTCCRLCVYLLFAAALPLVVGCVPVKNVVERWDAYEVDGAVVGRWTNAEEGFGMVLKMHDDGFATFHDADDMDAEPEVVLRTFEQGGQSFLLMVQYAAATSDFDEDVVEDASTGIVLMYTIDGDDMVWSTIKQEVIAEAIEAGDVAGEMVDGEPALESLDDDTLAWLAEAFADEDNREEETLSFSKQDD